MSGIDKHDSQDRYFCVPIGVHLGLNTTVNGTAGTLGMMGSYLYSIINTFKQELSPQVTKRINITCLDTDN